MSEHPISSVLVDGVPPAKGDLRTYEKTRTPLVLANAAEIETLNLATVKAVILGKSLFAYDADDITTPADGIDVLVSMDGRRYKRLRSADDLSLAALIALIGAGGLPVDRIAGGDPDTFLGRNEDGETVELPWTALVAALDELIGNADWRTPEPLVGRIVALPTMHTSAAGSHFRDFLMANGTVRSSGRGIHLANGDPAGNNQIFPFQVAASGAQPVFDEIWQGGNASYARQASTGYIWSRGCGTLGALGHGDTTNRALWKRIEYFVVNGITIDEVYPAPHLSNDDRACGCVFVSDAGVPYYCGSNADGEAGLGNTTQQNTPVRWGGGSGPLAVKVVMTGEPRSSVFIKTPGGQWYAAGSNTHGQLGLGDTVSPKNTPQLIGLSGIVDIAAGGVYTLALMNTGAVRACGYGGHGFGDGTTADKNVFTVLSSLTNAVKIAVAPSHQDGYSSAFAIVEPTPGDRQLRTWGWNGHATLGDGSTTNRSTPVTPTGTWQGDVDDAFWGGGGSYQGLIVRSGNDLWACGGNDQASLSNGTLSGDANTFGRVIGYVGNIQQVVATGSDAQWGLTVLTHLGCFSGGDNNEGQAGCGRTQNLAILQPVSVDGVSLRGLDGVQSSNGSVTDIIKLTQAEYDALGLSNPTTWYIVQN